LKKTALYVNGKPLLFEQYHIVAAEAMHAGEGEYAAQPSHSDETDPELISAILSFKPAASTAVSSFPLHCQPHIKHHDPTTNKFEKFAKTLKTVNHSQVQFPDPRLMMFNATVSHFGTGNTIIIIIQQ
jgi:hypothetical protein